MDSGKNIIRGGEIMKIDTGETQWDNDFVSSIKKKIEKNDGRNNDKRAAAYCPRTTHFPI